MTTDTRCSAPFASRCTTPPMSLRMIVGVVDAPDLNRLSNFCSNVSAPADSLAPISSHGPTSDFNATKTNTPNVDATTNRQQNEASAGRQRRARSLEYIGESTDAKNRAKIRGRTITPRAIAPATKTPTAATMTRTPPATPVEIANHGGGVQSSPPLATSQHHTAEPLVQDVQPERDEGVDHRRKQHGRVQHGGLAESVGRKDATERLHRTGAASIHPLGERRIGTGAEQHQEERHQQQDNVDHDDGV